MQPVEIHESIPFAPPVQKHFLQETLIVFAVLLLHFLALKYFFVFHKKPLPQEPIPVFVELIALPTSDSPKAPGSPKAEQSITVSNIKTAPVAVDNENDSLVPTITLADRIEQKKANALGEVNQEESISRNSSSNATSPLPEDPHSSKPTTLAPTGLATPALVGEKTTAPVLDPKILEQMFGNLKKAYEAPMKLSELKGGIMTPSANQSNSTSNPNSYSPKEKISDNISNIGLPDPQAPKPQSYSNEMGTPSSTSNKPRVSTQPLEPQSAQIDSTLVAGSVLTTIEQQIEQTLLYPQEALERGEQGTVYLLLTFSEAGSLRTITLARSSGFPLLDNAAQDALLSILSNRRFELSTQEHSMIFPVSFSLN